MCLQIFSQIVSDLNLKLISRSNFGNFDVCSHTILFIIDLWERRSSTNTRLNNFWQTRAAHRQKNLVDFIQIIDVIYLLFQGQIFTSLLLLLYNLAIRTPFQQAFGHVEIWIDIILARPNITDYRKECMHVYGVLACAIVIEFKPIHIYINSLRPPPNPTDPWTLLRHFLPLRMNQIPTSLSRCNFNRPKCWATSIRIEWHIQNSCW